MARLEITKQLETEQATLELAAKLATHCLKGGSIYLHGGLGAGKTTFSRYLLRGLGFAGTVKSPTYTLVESYQLPTLTVFHFDLYRLRDPEELEFMGIRDYFAPGNLCLVEWPERGEPLLSAPELALELSIASPTSRTLKMTALSEHGVLMLAGIAA